MVAITTEEEISLIFSILRSSSIDELNAVFHEVANNVLVDGSEKGGPKIAGVYGVWMEQSLSVSPSKKDVVQNFFKAAFSQVDFRFKSEQVRKKVNEWASRHTNNLIKNMLPSITSDTEWVYGNTIYFKGAWEHKFPKSLTSEQEFYHLDGTSVSVPFMTTTSRMQYIREYNDFKVLKLSFQQGSDINRRFSMYFDLPDDKDGLDNLVKRLASTPRFLDTHIPTVKVRVSLSESQSLRSTSVLRLPRLLMNWGWIRFRCTIKLQSRLIKMVQKLQLLLLKEASEGAKATAL